MHALKATSQPAADSVKCRPPGSEKICKFYFSSGRLVGSVLTTQWPDDAVRNWLYYKDTFLHILLQTSRIFYRHHSTLSKRPAHTMHCTDIRTIIAHANVRISQLGAGI